MIADPELGVVFQLSGRPEKLIPPRAIRKVLRSPRLQAQPGIPPMHRLHLWGDQSLSGTVLSLEDDQLRLRLSDGGVLRVPLYVLASVSHAQRQGVTIKDDFEHAGLAARRSAGGLRSSELVSSGAWSFRLARPGDQLAYELPVPGANGRLQVYFHDSGRRHAGLVWVCQLQFVSAVGKRTLEVELGWEADSYGVSTPQGPALSVDPVARRPGWNRLIIRFQPERILVLVGSRVLTDATLGLGRLSVLRFLVRDAEGRDPVFPKNRVSAGVQNPPPQRRPGQAFGYVDNLDLVEWSGSSYTWQPSREQDDVQIVGGDQLFGRIVQATERQVMVRGQFGRHVLPWPQVDQLHFAPRPCPVQLLDGLRVRMVFWGNGVSNIVAKRDTLVGILRELTDDQIHVHQAHIGPVRIRRRQLSELEFLSQGKWLQIDAGFHHFGDNFDLGLQVPHPEGHERTWRFELQEVPEQATLEFYAVALESPNPGARYFEELQDGHLRTYLSLNGRQLDPEGINHRVPANSRGAIRLRIPVPTGILKTGENILRLHQTPQKGHPSTFDDCGIFDLGLNLADHGGQ